MTEQATKETGPMDLAQILFSSGDHEHICCDCCTGYVRAVRA